MLRLVQIVFVGLIVLTAAFALEEHTLTAEQMGRYDRLTHELIAPCCWRESIAIHRSQEALQILDEVEKLVAEGRSEEEIRNIYVARYGPRILADPPGVSKYWLYVLPFSLLTWFWSQPFFDCGHSSKERCQHTRPRRRSYSHK